MLNINVSKTTILPLTIFQLYTHFIPCILNYFSRNANLSSQLEISKQRVEVLKAHLK